MTTSDGLCADPLDILLKHDHWGTRRVLEVCRGITQEAFHQKFEMGVGTLHDTLTHLIGAMRRWADRIGGRALRPAIDRPPRLVGTASEYRVRSADGLIELLDDAAADLARVAAEVRGPGGLGLGSVLEVQLDGRVYRFTRGAGFVHVTTHGSHHRAQCLNMLRQLGVKPLPELMVIDWQTSVLEGASRVQG
ncbi:MAG TPA: DinB family protein [Phycisphaerales bacterium]|nr:DinB family protein [Phycisphaerales bacterium]